MRKALYLAIAALALGGAPALLRAEVSSVGPGGFSVSHTAQSASAPGEVYRAIVEDIA